MTNFSLSSALKALSAFSLAVFIAGCNGGDSSAQLAESRAAYARRDLRTAEKQAVKAVKCNPRNVDALVQLARVDIDLGRIPDARKTIAKALELEPDASDVVLTAAEAAYHGRDYAFAMLQYRRLAEDAAQTPEVRSQAYAGIGVVQMSVQEFDIARIALFRAIRLNRRNPAAWYHLGLLYRDGFDRYYEASREAFNFYVRLEQTADIHMQKVQRSYIPDLNETINRKAASRPGVADRNSEKAAALIAEAEGLQKKGQLTKARKKYEDALAADPLSHKAALGLAVIIPKVEKTPAGAKKQLDAYRTACALQPTSTSTLMTTANLAFRLGFHAVAQDYYSRALATDPTDLAALDGIVKSCRKVGKGNIADAYQAYRDELAAKRK